MDINSSLQKTAINDAFSDRPADFRAELPLRNRNSQSEPMGSKELDLALKKLNYTLSYTNSNFRFIDYKVDDENLKGNFLPLISRNNFYLLLMASL